MPLKSQLFEGNARLNACLVKDAAHVVPGDVGAHVADIQLALNIIDGLEIVETERTTGTYGPSTVAAVLAYKKKRKIINRAYQTTEDNIVGKMTIASLDREMVERQQKPVAAGSRCREPQTSFRLVRR
jgi:peptidoglycan hydrolase-like protein with peptidoglycan-binding domain